MQWVLQQGPDKKVGVLKMPPSLIEGMFLQNGAVEAKGMDAHHVLEEESGGMFVFLVPVERGELLPRPGLNDHARSEYSHCLFFHFNHKLQAFQMIGDEVVIIVQKADVLPASLCNPSVAGPAPFAMRLVDIVDAIVAVACHVLRRPIAGAIIHDD